MGKFFLDLLTIVFTALLLCLPGISGKLWPIAFFAFIPLLLRIRNRSFASQFFISLLVFIIYLTYSVLWMKLYGWHWLLLENSMNAFTYALVFPLFFFIRGKFGNDPGFIILPIIYLVAEYGKSLGTFSFPWPALSHSQYANLAFIQVSEFTGAWGVTFLLLWVNSALFGIAVHPKRGLAIASLIPVTLCITGAYAFGYYSLTRAEPESTVTVSLFQRDVNTQHEWSMEVNNKAWNDYSGLTLAEWSMNLKKDEGGFIVWPEGAIPDALDEYPVDGRDSLTRKEMVEALIESVGKTFIIGTQFEDAKGPYNTAAVFGPDGALIDMYNKVHIVPFGEVIPLEKYIKSNFPQYPWGSESLIEGRELKGIDTPEGKVGIVICYESFFSDLVRRIILDDCDYLFLITNTSWFGESKASLQHAHFDAFRSIENRIWMSRAATTGVSSFIDPYGRPHNETDLYKKMAISRKIYAREKLTVYTRWGDWLPKMSIVVLLVMMTLALPRRNMNDENLGGAC